MSSTSTTGVVLIVIEAEEKSNFTQEKFHLQLKIGTV